MDATSLGTRKVQGGSRGAPVLAWKNHISYMVLNSFLSQPWRNKRKPQMSMLCAALSACSTRSGCLSQAGGLQQDPTAVLLKREVKWVSFMKVAILLYKSPTKCPFPELGNKEGFHYHSPNSISASTWTKSVLPPSLLFYPLKDIPLWLFELHPMPPQRVPFPVFLLVFVTITHSHMCPTNAELPTRIMPDMTSPEGCVYTELFHHVPKFWTVISAAITTWFHEGTHWLPYT